MDRYLAALRKLKVRMNNIQRSQDVGKSSKQLISETLEGQPSEITTVRNYVESSVDTSQDGLSRSLQGLFSLPIQYAWTTLRDPAGEQIAKAWAQQIAKPWEQVMAHRYPIAGSSRNEASVKDLQRFVDPDSGLLPAMAKGDTPAKRAVEASQHFTQPPPRYSEASLVKRLEELGIGRPSTYASIIQVLKDRAYVRVEKNRFFAEETGRWTPNRMPPVRTPAERQPAGAGLIVTAQVEADVAAKAAAEAIARQAAAAALAAAAAQPNPAAVDDRFAAMPPIGERELQADTVLDISAALRARRSS